LWRTKKLKKGGLMMENPPEKARGQWQGFRNLAVPKRKKLPDGGADDE